MSHILQSTDTLTDEDIPVAREQKVYLLTILT